MAKAALKAAREALNTKNYEEAINLSKKVLLFEPQNYNAHVFLGLGYVSLENYAEAEHAYLEATEIDNKSLLAWQGLWNLYDKKHDLESLQKMTDLICTRLMNNDERERCFTTMNKFQSSAQQYGTPEQKFQALKLLTPEGGTFYDYLEGLVPSVALLYMQMADIQEYLDKTYFDTEVAKRKNRLGAKLNQVMYDVDREIYSSSPLETIYQNIINWSHDEQVRRITESKLLHFFYKQLLLSDLNDKSPWLEKLTSLADDIVTLELPEQLAWSIHLEWADHRSFLELERTELTKYCELFPETPLASALEAFLQTSIGRLLLPSPKKPDNDGEVKASEPEKGQEEAATNEVAVEEESTDGDQVFALFIDCLDANKDSILIHEMFAIHCYHIKDYETLTDLCTRGLDLLQNVYNSFSVTLEKLKLTFSLLLAIAYTHVEVPRYHPQALRLYELVLSSEPANAEALIGRSDIELASDRTEDAVATLQLLLATDTTNFIAHSNLSWCYHLLGQNETALKTIKKCFELCDEQAVTSAQKSELYYRLGTYLWNDGIADEDQIERAFSAFVSSLRANPNFAPAYTSLGFYYEHFHDQVRSTKCYQKAFELDAREFAAAEKLAKEFAASNEWELVELVARRVLTTERSGITRRLRINWHYKALGVVSLNTKNYENAISHFQSALRINARDAHCWSGLGEAYSRSGRYAAALKAFHRAELLNPEDWYTTYMVANIQMDIGEYDEALTLYEDILLNRKNELCVLVSKSKTLVKLANSEYSKGYYARAIQHAEEVIGTCAAIFTINNSYVSPWKSLGDAIQMYANVQKHMHEFPLDKVRAIMTDGKMLKMANSNNVSSLNDFHLDGATVDAALITKCVIVCYNMCLALTAKDAIMLPAAWYNLSVAFFELSKLEGVEYMKVAISCVKQSIKLESKNGDFWSFLGILLAKTGAYRASQHCFIRSLICNEKNAGAWTSLGGLYLQCAEYDLAETAFARAQSIDPDYVQAWLGRAFLSILVADEANVSRVCYHARAISNGNHFSANYWYAYYVFQNVLNTSTVNESEVWDAIYSIGRVISERPRQAHAYYLLTNLLERLGLFERAIAVCTDLGTLLEEDYERTESHEALRKFIDSKLVLGRLYLQSGRFNETIENLSVVSDLLEGEDTDVRLKMQLDLVLGLAHYFTGNLTHALSAFQQTLEESTEDPDVVVLVSKALWAIGDENAKQAAREQLLDALQQHPDMLDLLLCLGAMGVSDGDEAVMEAAQESLEQYVLEHKLNEQECNLILELIHAIYTLQHRDIQRFLQQFVFIHPHLPTAWAALTKTKSTSAYDLAKTLQRILGSYPTSPGDLAFAFRQQMHLGELQKAAFLAPWADKNRLCLLEHRKIEQQKA
ncbi:ski complex TPR repeat subunit Ski3 [Schizosaccharomyces japonicus yFS275]|uniref:Ski complex TPR repeat subunit Ski3 n=1 Tax=Schizosaccharomyces japonicus (strain yFS275 / FY16936) TaxID=402676 RepID=B6K539_SCHJY|nr:ski complex TPR repeat subunit Ski3 [Schizosaccharomyces japonicus yFS275]EEB08643.1 ski complex TPR repeat subunit Ski3 [Schizosaccharomyces japonicus yFS275]